MPMCDWWWRGAKARRRLSALQCSRKWRGGPESNDEVSRRWGRLQCVRLVGFPPASCGAEKVGHLGDAVALTCALPGRSKEGETVRQDAKILDVAGKFVRWQLAPISNGNHAEPRPLEKDFLHGLAPQLSRKIRLQPAVGIMGHPAEPVTDHSEPSQHHHAVCGCQKTNQLYCGGASFHSFMVSWIRSEI